MTGHSRVNWRPDWLRERGPDLAAAEDAERRAERTRAMVQRLRETRTKRGLSLPDVEQVTRINRTYLQAIEDGRFEELPAPVYARGFVRSYARHLGLDPEEAVAAVPSDLPRPLGLEPMPGLRRTAPAALPAVNLPVAGAIAIGAVLVLAAFFLLPRIAGDSGIELPAATSTAAAGATSGTTAAATVPPFEDGTTPDFTGVVRAEAQRVLAELGVTPLIVEAADRSAAGLVFDQSPAPGTTLRQGDVVTLFVSGGP